jgi:hypothetical protein
MLPYPLKHNHTTFVVKPGDHYMLLQNSTSGRSPTFSKVFHESPPCNAKIFHNRPLWHHVGSLGNHKVPFTILRSRPPLEVSLISKQVIPYQTCGGTDCSRVYSISRKMEDLNNDS